MALLRLEGAGPLGGPSRSGVGATAQAPASRVEEGAGSFINRGFLWLCTPTPCCCHVAGSSLGLQALASEAPGSSPRWGWGRGGRPEERGA